MEDLKKYIQSGILEMYALGLTSEEESVEVTQLSKDHAEISAEIDEIINTLIKFSAKSDFNPTLKTFLFATIDFSERRKKGEPENFPEILNEHSKINDYKQWLDREDMILPKDFTEAYAKIIAHTPKATTAMVWLKTGSPLETHANEFEKFLIVEGSCDITVEEKVYQLVSGSYLSIPLHKSHHVKITSAIPCKLILQRVAA